jgi:hypothetical protein
MEFEGTLGREKLIERRERPDKNLRIRKNSISIIRSTILKT